MAVTPVDIGGSILKGLQINALKQQMEAQKQATEERNALKSLYAERFGGNDPKTGIAWNTGRQGPGAMNNDQFVGRAMAISPEAGVNWQKYYAGLDAAALERKKAEAPIIAAALNGVQDQGGWDRARAFMMQNGVDVTDMPQQFDPSLSNMSLQAARYLGNITDPKGPEPTQLAKLIAERDALPSNDPRRAAYDDAIVKASTNAPGVNVNLPGAPKFGTIPPGYMLVGEGENARLVKIQGGPAAEEASAAEQAQEQRSGQRAAQTAVVVQTIDDVLKTEAESWWPVTGGMGSLAANVPGSTAADVARNLETIKANIGFDKLQQMRENSKTGGALGNVSEMENRLLQSTMGSLEQSQSPDQFRRNLERLRRYMLATVNGVELNGAVVSLGTAAEMALASGRSLDDVLSGGRVVGGTQEAQSGTQENPARITGDDEYNALQSGAFFMGPDNVLRQKP